MVSNERSELEWLQPFGPLNSCQFVVSPAFLRTAFKIVLLDNPALVFNGIIDAV